MNIHDLSEYQLYKLKAIDPTLSSDWYDVIQDILPKLNNEGQVSVYKNILRPRGIIISPTKSFTYKPPESLESVFENLHTTNKELLVIARHMLRIIDPKIKKYDAMKLADEVEAILSYLDNLDIKELISDHINRQKIRTAFLYDLAPWIDTIDLDVDSGIRKLNPHMVKAYFKEVFLKHQIQGSEFGHWDSSDLSFHELTHLPEFIKKQGQDRRLFIVEGVEYWFLIGSANKVNKNAYSFRRFLYEDDSGEGDEKYIYLTHIVLNKNRMQNPRYMTHATYCMSRLYTLDVSVSDNLIKSIHEIQQLYKQYLQPLLKEPLKQDGSDPETVIRERLARYEKQLSILVLQKLPAMIEASLDNVNDQDYLFYHVDRLIKKMNENLQDFRLQPFAKYSSNSEIMAVKLMSMARILNKSRSRLFAKQSELEDNVEVVKPALTIIREKLQETEASIDKLNVIRETVEEYNRINEKGTMWQKLTLGKAPEYTLDDLKQMEKTLQEDFFMSILRLAKTHNASMIYVEFECNKIVNANYRHYALADGVMGISRLPLVLRLNQDKSNFNLQSIKDIINQDLYKANSSA